MLWEGDATLCVHPGILGIEHCRVGSHGHGEALVHVQHLQPGAGHRVLGWQIGQQEVLADGRAPCRRR